MTDTLNRIPFKMSYKPRGKGNCSAWFKSKSKILVWTKANTKKFCAAELMFGLVKLDIRFGDGGGFFFGGGV